jgi:hypothetical protein
VGLVKIELTRMPTTGNTRRIGIPNAKIVELLPGTDFAIVDVPERFMPDGWRLMPDGKFEDPSSRRVLVELSPREVSEWRDKLRHQFRGHAEDFNISPRRGPR